IRPANGPNVNFRAELCRLQLRKNLCTTRSIPATVEVAMLQVLDCSLCAALLVSGVLGTTAASHAQQPAFAVATIRPSAAQVLFEHDGSTEFSRDVLRMRDVTLNTCIKLAYGVQDSQISGPAWLRSDHFDITAKTDDPA